MKLWTRFLILALALVSLLTLGIKFYFMSEANHYLELSVQDQMKRDMQAFENIILVVTKVACQNKEVVRSALAQIDADPNIPVELRRSEFIIRQFGNKPGHEAKDPLEQEVFRTGEPRFRKNERFFEYIYPLKANGICQNCHIDRSGNKVPAGYVLGLAIKRVPKSVLKENSLSYRIMDLFWENLAMVIFVFLVLVFALYYWFVYPLYKLARRVEPRLVHLDDDFVPPENDIELLDEGIQMLLKNSGE